MQSLVKRSGGMHEVHGGIEGKEVEDIASRNSAGPRKCDRWAEVPLRGAEEKGRTMLKDTMIGTNLPR